MCDENLTSSVLQTLESALHDAVWIPELSEKVSLFQVWPLAALDLDQVHCMGGGEI